MSQGDGFGSPAESLTVQGSGQRRIESCRYEQFKRLDLRQLPQRFWNLESLGLGCDGFQGGVHILDLISLGEKSAGYLVDFSTSRQIVAGHVEVGGKPFGQVRVKQLGSVRAG